MSTPFLLKIVLCGLLIETALFSTRGNAKTFEELIEEQAELQEKLKQIEADITAFKADAATKIQSTYKVHIARKQLKQLKEKSADLARESQQASELQAKNYAARRIQNFLRGVLQRKNMAEIKTVQNKDMAARKIQSFYRNYSNKKRAHELSEQSEREEKTLIDRFVLDLDRIQNIKELQKEFKRNLEAVEKDSSISDSEREIQKMRQLNGYVERRIKMVLNFQLESLRAIFKLSFPDLDSISQVSLSESEVSSLIAPRDDYSRDSSESFLEAEAKRIFAKMLDLNELSQLLAKAQDAHDNTIFSAIIKARIQKIVSWVVRSAEPEEMPVISKLHPSLRKRTAPIAPAGNIQKRLPHDEHDEHDEHSKEE